MASTKYNLFVGDEAEARATKSKRAQAVELADSIRKEEGVAVRVVTEAGKVVHEAAAPRKINMSRPYTRVVDLPEGVVVPDGFRVCYHRPRRQSALLHDAEAGEYRILNTKTGKLRKGIFATTREGGKAMLALEV